VKETLMLLEKRAPTVEELESQMALELPDRQTLHLIVIRNVLNNNRIRVEVEDINVAVQVCAVIDLLSNVGVDFLTCKVIQT